MGEKNLYILKFNGLTDGLHEFNYHVSQDLFHKFDDNFVQKADLDIKIQFVKRKDMLVLNFDINGNIELVCDICLDNFRYKIEYKPELFVEFGDFNSDLSNADKSITITQNEIELVLDQHIYDYIMICIPNKKVHPKDEKGNSTCNTEMLKKIEEYTTVEEEEEEKEVDERWNKLKNLYN